MSRALVMNPPEELVAAVPASMPMQGQFIWKPAKMTEAQKRQAKREQKRAQEIDYVLREEVAKQLESQQEEIKKAMTEQRPLEFKMKTKITPDDIDKTLYLMDRLQKVKKPRRRKKKPNPIGMELMLPNPPKKKGTSVAKKGQDAPSATSGKRRKKRRTKRNPPLGVAALFWGGGTAVGVQLISRLVAKFVIRKKLLESVAAGPATTGKVITYYGGWAAANIAVAALINGGLWMGTKNFSERNAVLVGGAIPPLVDLFAAVINIVRNINKPEEVQKIAKAELTASAQKQPQQQKQAIQQPAPEPKQLPAPVPEKPKGEAPGSGSGTGTGARTTTGSGGTEPVKVVAQVEPPKATTAEQATTMAVSKRKKAAGSSPQGDTASSTVTDEIQPIRGDRRIYSVLDDDDELYGEEELSEEELSDGDDDELYGEEELSEEELSEEEMLEEEMLEEEELSEEELSEEELSADDQEELELLSGLPDEELAEIEAAEGLERGYMSPLQAFRVSKRINSNKSFVTQEV